MVQVSEIQSQVDVALQGDLESHAQRTGDGCSLACEATGRIKRVCRGLIVGLAQPALDWRRES